MTAALLEWAANDAEALMVAWLNPLPGFRVAAARVAGDPLPFILVTHITGREDADIGLSDPVVSVHTLCDKSLGYDNAKITADTVHRRMLQLCRHQDAIELPNLLWANVDYCQVEETPIWVPFEDNRILRKVGRYKFGLSYVTATGT